MPLAIYVINSFITQISLAGRCQEMYGDLYRLNERQFTGHNTKCISIYSILAELPEFARGERAAFELH